VPNVPLVTVLVAVHDGEAYLRAALTSVLRQSVTDLELVVVDDGSTDSTPTILRGLEDERIRVLRSDEQLGLAGALNLGLDAARGRYLARMDADDAAFPFWLERSLELLAARPNAGLAGSGVLDVDADGRPGPVHVHEGGFAAMRWRALFSAPVFHNTVVLDRELLERHGLRYDTAYGESEDYDLWTRFLHVTEGDSVEAPLVLHRLHPEQASRRRGELQRTLAHDISLREIRALAPDLDELRAARARAVALADAIAPDDVEDAVEALIGLLERFESEYASTTGGVETARRAAARALARVSRSARGSVRLSIIREAARLDPLLPAHLAARRRRRHALTRAAQRDAAALMRRLEAAPDEPPVRVAAVFPEPTLYRAPLLDRIAASPGIELIVVYASETVADRTWHVEPVHEAVFLRGLRVPGARRVLHHDYPVTPGVVGALTDVRPDVVVISGWSTFAAQAAIAWCRVKDVPYLLVVESHDEGPRAGWRKTVKGTVVPPIVERAAGLLVTGTLARDSMIARGAHPERVRIFANTIDVDAFGQRADALAAMRPELRRALGAGQEDVIVLSVARLAREKGLDTLLRAVADADDPRILLVVAGEGPERALLSELADDLSVRLVLAGDVDWKGIVELYAAADVFALLSDRETWAVVVNEAAACGLPLVLSGRVGAAHDLLRDGENGTLVAAGDVTRAARALHELAADEKLRRTQGARSREPARDWGYGPSVEAFLEAVREAVHDRG
jgi:glycosyltransferase involved in cell wall biosynthesis